MTAKTYRYLDEDEQAAAEPAADDKAAKGKKGKTRLSANRKRST